MNIEARNFCNSLRRRRAARYTSRCVQRGILHPGRSATCSKGAGKDILAMRHIRARGRLCGNDESGHIMTTEPRHGRATY